MGGMLLVFAGVFGLWFSRRLAIFLLVARLHPPRWSASRWSRWVRVWFVIVSALIIVAGGVLLLQAVM
jgi:hypothetical protein